MRLFITHREGCCGSRLRELHCWNSPISLNNFTKLFSLFYSPEELYTCEMWPCFFSSAEQLVYYTWRHFPVGSALHGIAHCVWLCLGGALLAPLSCSTPCPAWAILLPAAFAAAALFTLAEVMFLYPPGSSGAAISSASTLLVVWGSGL